MEAAAQVKTVAQKQKENLFDFGSSKYQLMLTRTEVFTMIKPHIKSELNVIINHLENEIAKMLRRTVIIPEHSRITFCALLSDIKKKWRQAQREEKRFFNRFKDWVSTVYYFQGFVTEEKELYIIKCTTNSNDLSQVIDESSDPELKLSECEVSQCSADEALAFMIFCKFNKYQYEVLQTSILDNKCDLYPPYSEVAEAKRRCYPVKTAIHYDISSAHVDIQALLNQTVDRILLIPTIDVEHLENEELWVLNFNCDGISGVDYNNSNHKVSFMSIVPLVLLRVDTTRMVTVVVWSPICASSYTPRPLSLQMMSTEGNDMARDEQFRIKQIEEQLKELIPYSCTLNGTKLSVSYNLNSTIIDGQLYNPTSHADALNDNVQIVNKNDEAAAELRVAVCENCRSGLLRLHLRIYNDLCEEDFLSDPRKSIKRIFNWLIAASDPYISYLRIITRETISKAQLLENGSDGSLSDASTVTC